MSNARFSILQAKAVKDQRISDAQFRTLAALGMYADEDGWCFPSLTRIGGDLGKSKQAAGRDVIALRKLGYLEIWPQFDPETGARKPSKYRLVFDSPRQPVVDAPSTPEVDTPSTSEVDVNDPVNDPKNVMGAASAPAPRSRKKGDILDGMIAAAQEAERRAAVEGSTVDLMGKIQGFPDDCQPTLQWLAQRFGWGAASIPSLPGRKKRGGHYAQWINEIREVNRQLAGTGEQGLAAAAKACDRITISHPGAITWALAGEVGRLRRQQEEERKPRQFTRLQQRLLEEAKQLPASEWTDMQRRVMQLAGLAA